MHALKTEVLGYEQYVTYGEDVTANVSDLIAARYPDRVAGIVATHAHFPTGDERQALTDTAELAFFAKLAERPGTDGAHGHVQATRPDTLAAALNDSPPACLHGSSRSWSNGATDYPESLARRQYLDLRAFARLAEGGHFTVAEVPDEMASRMREFVQSIGAYG